MCGDAVAVIDDATNSHVTGWASRCKHDVQWRRRQRVNGVRTHDLAGLRRPDRRVPPASRRRPQPHSVNGPCAVQARPSNSLKIAPCQYAGASAGTSNTARVGSVSHANQGRRHLLQDRFPRGHRTRRCRG